MSRSLYDINVTRITGERHALQDFAGQVLLIVNVASKCGLTPQYTGLEALYQAYKDRGLTLLGFPANDFAGQEPGSDAEIQSFCSTQYEVTFPLFSKIVATGEARHPLYSHLIAEQPVTENRAAMEAMLRGYQIEPTPAPEVVWNFEKFLISREGKVLRRFAPDTQPDDPALRSAIEAALG